jgi:hypothetical protein
VIQPGSLDELARRVRRPASLGRIVTGRLTPLLHGSILGGVEVALPDESWPMDDGRPMVGLAQLNLADAPFVPPSLRDIALLTIFLGLDGDALAIPDHRANGDGWLVRAYANLEDLVPLHDRTQPAWLRRRLEWDRIEDLPALEDLLDIVDGDALDRLLDGGDWETDVGSPASGTKLGGWPDLVQGELEWGPEAGRAGAARASDRTGAAAPEFCLQVDSDARVGLNLWDGGVLYVGRAGTGDERHWVAAGQFL